MNQTPPDPIIPKNLPDEEIIPSSTEKKELNELFAEEKAKTLHVITIKAIQFGAVIIVLKISHLNLLIVARFSVFIFQGTFGIITPSTDLPSLIFTKISCRVSEASPCNTSLYAALYVEIGTIGCLLFTSTR